MARYLLSARNRVVWKRVMQMKMKKRIALLLAAAMLSLILCGCADDAETVGAVRSDGSVSDALATGLGVTVPGTRPAGSPRPTASMPTWTMPI